MAHMVAIDADNDAKMLISTILPPFDIFEIASMKNKNAPRDKDVPVMQSILLTVFIVVFL